ncbi:ROK family protein [Mycoplasma flocculare]|uniref:ROK family protein n=1 Tax=Mesomycoplasma flocculare TaxID=2128 RepID=A0AAW9X9I2_MESFC|nr:ROK family protein [Mesomycoplasma flocculare]MXR39350.1 ROK family protein [Mycoplasma sp. MF12]MXR05764.1 ROK family protein [Mesomycoplasma flocculare]MXR12135.1 ROK family protein [Mesomycoplasma flocculare]MXR22730.1 ROK family protein [Mesomycoplasma flocculare]MXR55853.1 ROK family protein [Mesomycoplasma flocculare]
MKKYNFAAIDIGGTNTRFAIFNNNKIIKKIKFTTDVKNYKKILDKILDLVNKYQINAIALCIPGPADYQKGIILSSPNLVGWNGINIKKYLLNNSKLEYAIFENDANAMAFANHIFYKNTKKGVTQFYTISTGFGAGLVINNKIFHGSEGFGQEIAHIPTAKTFNKKHHLNNYAAELFVSGTGMSLRAKDKNLEETEPKNIIAKYDHYKEYKQIVDDCIDTLARTISITIGILNPNLIVFGGSVAEYNFWIIQKAIEKAKLWTNKNQWKTLRFEKDAFGDDSALFGLYYLILEKTKT